MKIKSLSHAGITVKDFSKAVKWYWEVFKFPLLSETHIDEKTVQELNSLYNLEKGISVKLGFLRCPKGGVIEIFEFSKNAKANHAWNRPGPSHLTLDAKGIEKWHEKLSAMPDVEVLCEPRTVGGAVGFFFKDPDGNLIELIDLKFNYFAIRKLGKLAGFFMRKGAFKNYYK